MSDTSQRFGINALSLSLFLTGLVVLISRILMLDFPAGNDESMYFLLGQETLNGQVPYATFYEMKPPFLFYNYALIAFLFGYTSTGLHLGALFISLVNAGLIYALGRSLYSGVKPGIAALVFWILISSPYLNGTYLLGEHFVLLYLLGAFYFIVSSENTEKVRLLIAGALFAVAILTKQTAVFFIPVALLLLWQNKEGIQFWQKIAWMGLGGVIVLFFNAMILVFTGSFDDAMYWIFSHSKAYSAPIKLSEAKISFSFFGKQFFTNHWLLILLAFAGIITLILRKNKASLLFIGLLFLGGFLSLLPGLRFYSQYWILLIPALAFAIIEIPELKPEFKWGNLLLSAGLLMAVLTQATNYFPGDKEKFSDRLYNGQYFSKIKNLSVRLDRMMTKEDNLLVLGGMPQVYLYTDKSSITRHVWAPMINYQNEKCAEFRKELMADFEKTMPEYVFFSFNTFHWSMTKDQSNEVYNYMFRQMQMNYNKIMAMDLDNGNVFYQDQIANFNEKANSLIIYKRKR